MLYEVEGKVPTMYMYVIVKLKLYVIYIAFWCMCQNEFVGGNVYVCSLVCTMGSVKLVSWNETYMYIYMNTCRGALLFYGAISG